jgi:hypothetical protein
MMGILSLKNLIPSAYPNGAKYFTNYGCDKNFLCWRESIGKNGLWIKGEKTLDNH